MEEARQLLDAGRRDRLAFDLLCESGRAPAETVGFLAQQACEKFLKAALVRVGVAPGRTHDLEFLLDLALEAGLDVPVRREDLRRLNPYAVAFRYEPSPGDWIRADQASQLVEPLHQWAVDLLGPA
jgi:HEPN domain-containing protein